MRDVAPGDGRDILPGQGLERLARTALVALDGEHVVRRAGVIHLAVCTWVRSPKDQRDKEIPAGRPPVE